MEYLILVNKVYGEKFSDLVKSTYIRCIYMIRQNIKSVGWKNSKCDSFSKLAVTIKC